MAKDKIEKKMSHLEKYTYIYIHFILICRYMYQLTSDDSTMTVMWQYWITVIFPYVCLLYGLKRESPTPTHTQHSSFFSQPSPHRWPCGIPLPLELLLLLGIFNPKGKKYAHLLFTVKSRSYLPHHTASTSAKNMKYISTFWLLPPWSNCFMGCKNVLNGTNILLTFCHLTGLFWKQN